MVNKLLFENINADDYAKDFETLQKFRLLTQQQILDRNWLK